MACEMNSVHKQLSDMAKVYYQDVEGKQWGFVYINLSLLTDEFMDTLKRLELHGKYKRLGFNHGDVLIVD
jgi:hypothetical protein